MLYTTALAFFTQITPFVMTTALPPIDDRGDVTIPWITSWAKQGLIITICDSNQPSLELITLR